MQLAGQKNMSERRASAQSETHSINAHQMYRVFIGRESGTIVYSILRVDHVIESKRYTLCSLCQCVGLIRRACCTE